MSPTSSSTTTAIVMNGSTGSRSPQGLNLGTNGRPSGSTNGSRMLPHIDDIRTAQPKVDVNTPIERVLVEGENCMKSATTFCNFGRTDLALKEYLKSTTVAVDIMPRHKDFESLHDRRALAGRYHTLKQAINANFSTFEQIKKDIVADNAKTRVQPSAARPLSPEHSSTSGRTDPRSSIDDVVYGKPNGSFTAGHTQRDSRTGSSEESENSTAAAYQPRAKPVVHPKPQSLHGNAINHSTNGSTNPSKTVQDLAARFANLRSANPLAQPTQDPRIRTRPILPPVPLASSSGELGYKPKISLSGVLPDMPKAPDAVYSPARGSISGESSKVPPSTPRGTFTRTTSTASFTTSNATPRASPALPGDYFALSHGVGGSGAPDRRSESPVLEDEAVSVEELLKLMDRGSRAFQILLIDVRSRDTFDEGHIMSQATICIEPDILLREDISANEIAESMVLAPPRELMLFEQRLRFHLIVFYDQDSTALRWRGASQSEKAMMSLYNALVHYDFGDESKARKPKLLKGGLDAWVSVMGSGSLQESATVSAKHSQMHRVPSVKTGFNRPKSRYVTRPIQNEEEVQKWNETLSFARSSEQVIRRDPAVFNAKESMTDPAVSRDARFAFGSSHQAVALNNLPTAPARPAPALPRKSYSGVRETQEEDDYVLAKLSQPGGAQARRKFPGLRNPGNWCYANSAIQSLVASPGFGYSLASGKWQDTWRVPKKKGEFIAHPQLMSKILANLFHWMETGDFDAMQAKTLMEYSYYINKKDPIDGDIKDESEILGGQCQQDTQEFWLFLLMELHDETNTLRDKEGNPSQPVLADGDSILQGAMKFWEHYKLVSDSLVDMYWRGVEVTTTRCKRCMHRNLNYNIFDTIALDIDPYDCTDAITSLRNTYLRGDSAETPEDYKCDNCGSTGTSRRESSLARLPKLLAFYVRRFEFNGRQSVGKINDRFTFPIHGLDMEPYFIDRSERATSPAEVDVQFRGPFLYDCYAVICHGGSTAHNGHYISYTCDSMNAADRTRWHEYNDQRVTPMEIGSGRLGDQVERLYKNGQFTPYMMFYKLRDAK